MSLSVLEKEDGVDAVSRFLSGREAERRWSQGRLRNSGDLRRVTGEVVSQIVSHWFWGREACTVAPFRCPHATRSPQNHCGFQALIYAAVRRFRPFRSFGPLTRFTWSSHDSSVVGSMCPVLGHVRIVSLLLSSSSFPSSVAALVSLPYADLLRVERIPIFRWLFQRDFPLWSSSPGDVHGFAGLNLVFNGQRCWAGGWRRFLSRRVVSRAGQWYFCWLWVARGLWRGFAEYSRAKSGISLKLWHARLDECNEPCRGWSTLSGRECMWVILLFLRFFSLLEYSFRDSSVHSNLNISLFMFCNTRQENRSTKGNDRAVADICYRLNFISWLAGWKPRSKFNIYRSISYGKNNTSRNVGPISSLQRHSRRKRSGTF